MMTKNLVAAVALMALVITGIAFAGTGGPSPVPNPPTFTISANVLTLCKGETNYVPITVTNYGNGNPSVGVSRSGEPMQYVQLAVTQTKSLMEGGNGTVTIGSVGPGNSIAAYLPVFVNANASLITSMGVGISYYYLQFYTDSEIRNLTFEVQTCPAPLSIGITPKTLASGQIQNLSINITNIGGATLRAVYAHYSVPNIDGAIIGSAQAEIGNLYPLASYRFNASLFVSRNASIESFPFNLTVTFYNGTNSIEQITNSTSLIPIGAINLQASGVTISPSTVVPGDIFSISFILTNIGTSGASAVTVSSLPQNDFTSFGSNPVYVGDIGTDSQAPVTVTLRAGNSTGVGTYNMSLKINYLNSLRQNVSKVMNVSVVVTGLSGSGAFNSTHGAVVKTSSGSGIEILVVILLIAVVVLGYFLYKEKKRNKGHQK